ncbi:MAG: HNH endonuclease signature motif containing protein [Chloroflexota bacterium]
MSEKSNYLCSYCKTAEEVVGTHFTIDHILPESMGGPTTIDNLCLACWDCNLAKSNRIMAKDMITGQTVRLFDPNQQLWEEHFEWNQNGLIIMGLTSIGRATVDAIKLNRPPLVRSRRLWIKFGLHPPNL